MAFFDLAAQTLISPPVLFFILGLMAALVRSDLNLPEAVAKGLSLYLVMAIGFKGGVEMNGTSLVSVGGVLMAGILLSALLPLAGFALLRATSSLGRIDAAAIAAHYGSISIVTFIAAGDSMLAMGDRAGGYMVAVAAAMEAPAILTGLILAGQAARQGQLPASGQGGFLRECLANGSVVLLLGSFAIGWATGPSGLEMVSPLFVDVFRGMLCLFLLDMGLIAGRGLLANRRLLSAPVIGFGLYMPLVGAAFALGVSVLLGLDHADAAILMTLAASASYIAVPAALRLALPQAQAGLSLTLSLGLTFPFNLIIGIPLYYAVAKMVLLGEGS